DGAAVIGRGRRLDLDVQVFLQLGEDRVPASRDLAGVLGGEQRERDFLRPRWIRRGCPGGDRQHGDERNGSETSQHHDYLLSMAARRTRAETPSVTITMATMSKITVAASRSLKERIVSQR